MAGPKPQRLDFGSPTSSHGKRSKTELPSPHKMAPLCESPEMQRVILEEIRGVKELVQSNGEAIRAMREDLTMMQERLEGLSLRQDKMAETLESHAVRMGKIDKAERQILLLQKELEDSNNRARRNNIRLIGAPEGVEAGDLREYLGNILPSLLKTTFLKDLEIDRAHRVPTNMALNRTTPRPIIFRLLRYQQAEQILAAARANHHLEIDGHKVSFFPDLSKPTMDRRKKLLAYRPRLQQLQARFGLLYPAKLRVTLHNHTRTFEDPDLLAAFLDSKEAELMR